MRGKKGSGIAAPELVCQHCGTAFVPRRYSQCFIGKLKYCSVRCSVLARAADPNVQAKISATSRDRESTPEAKERRRQIARRTWTGRTHTDETKAKLSATQRRRFKDPAVKKAFLEACTGSRFTSLRCKGDKNHSWNPDRLAVATRKKLSWAWHGFVRRLLKATGKRKAQKTEEMLGFTLMELKAHLESRFLPGMTWENYGRNGWHIDHIRPIISFPPDTPASVVNALSNLQPLWACDNAKKSDRYHDSVEPIGLEHSAMAS